MAAPVIQVSNLSKSYRIGLPEKQVTTLRASITQFLTRPFQYFQQVIREPLPEEIIWALKGISFEVQQGEIIGVIGRNGAGKSTLLKILSRITEPTRGYVDIRGRVGSLLEVGTGFNPELTGRENIYLNGTILGMKKKEIDRKLDEIIDFSGVEKFIDTPVKRYSSGMGVRLAFAVAAHLEPEILILDEVLAVGDDAFQKKCIGKIKDITTGQGRTVLFVSHGMATVIRLTERCIYLKDGQIMADGKSQQIIEEYLKEHKSDGMSRDLTGVKRDWTVAGELPKWQITQVQIVVPQEILVANQPITVEMEYLSRSYLEDVVIGMGIANIFGTRLISCRSEDIGLTVTSKMGERGKVTMQIHAPYLSAGRYILQVGAHNGTSHLLDYVGEALEFEVVKDPKDVWAMERPNLGLRLPSTWQIEKSCIV